MDEGNTCGVATLPAKDGRTRLLLLRGATDDHEHALDEDEHQNVVNALTAAERLYEKHFGAGGSWQFACVLGCVADMDGIEWSISVLPVSPGRWLITAITANMSRGLEHVLDRHQHIPPIFVEGRLADAVATAEKWRPGEFEACGCTTLAAP